MDVDSKIKLYNNDLYGVFNDWFVKRYNGRVELFSNSVAINNNSANKFVNMPQPKVLDSEASKVASDVLDSTTTISVVDQSSVVKPTEVKEPGFVSYVLLGVVVAVVSLVILYMLL